MLICILQLHTAVDPQHVRERPAVHARDHREQNSSEVTLGKLRAVRDALVLVALVARVDQTAWRYVLFEHCGVGLEGRESFTDDDNFRKARFMIELSDLDPRAVVQGLFSALDAPLSMAFAVAARKIATNRAFHMPKLEALNIPIAFYSEACPTETPLHLAHLYRALKRLQSEHGGWCVSVDLPRLDHSATPFSCAFVVESTDIDTLRGYPTPEIAEVIGEIVGNGDGLPLERLALIPEMKDTTGLDPARVVQTLGKLFTRMLCPSDCVKGKVPVIRDVFLS